MAQEQLRLVDGTIVRKCPTIKPLYCSRAGKFYSVHNAILTDDGWVMREIKLVLKQSGTRRCTFTNGTGTHYPFMRNFQNKHCHSLVAAAWLGSRPEGMVIDHLNGNILDWSADNLEYVTPEENRKRARLLRVLRSVGREPREMSYAELGEIFRKYRFEEPEKIMEADMTQHRDRQH